jgi:hypothetical protein
MVLNEKKHCTISMVFIGLIIGTAPPGKTLDLDGGLNLQEINRTKM